MTASADPPVEPVAWCSACGTDVDVDGLVPDDKGVLHHHWGELTVIPCGPVYRQEGEG